MKLYKRIALTLCVVAVTSCSLDLRQDPSPVQQGQLPGVMLNSMQRNLAYLFNAASQTGSSLTRQIGGGSSIYRTTITPEGFNGVWSTAYAGILNDANQLMKISVPDKSQPNVRYARHMGITRIIQAYTLILLVDMFGDVPFSKAFAGDVNFNPPVDTQVSLYAKALQLLDSAKLDLTTATTTSPSPGYLSPIAPDVFDMYYGNGSAAPTTDFSKWVKLANSLKIKIFLNLRFEDVAAAQAGIAALIIENNFIDDQNENFVYRYGATTASPDARHPQFISQYTAGGGDYQSNHLMWTMLHGYDMKHRNLDLGDPRVRFYFYRQVLANSTSTNEIPCLGDTRPSHYPFSTGSAIMDNAIAGRAPMGVNPKNPTNDPADVAWGRTFCYPSDRGYWGRDHLDPHLIPPDALLRTAYGPYPVGGRFDANNGTAVASSQGMRGAGMEPIMMRSFVQFMLAEASLYMAVGGSGAATYFSNGVKFSLTDVRDWAVNGTFGASGLAAAATEATQINSFYPLAYTGTPATGGNVAAATTGNIVLSGLHTIDNVALLAGDRVLVKNQTTASENGIYDVAAGAWTRSVDADTQAELLNMSVQVNTVPTTIENVNGGTRWLQTTTGTITVGTTSLTFAANHSWNNDAANYLAEANAAFANRALVSNDAAMNYVAREYWISAFRNGVEAYNLYRRTGFPTGMQPVISPTPGPFPKSYWYPANFVNLNNTISQKADLTIKIFWDKNPANPNLDF